MNPAPGGSYRVDLRLRGRRVVVVGGGQGAHRAVAGLLAAGATVSLVSPVATPALEALASSGSVTWVPRRYQPGDLSEAWYVVAATDDAAVNTAIAQEAERARVFCRTPDGAEREGAPGAAAGRVVLVGGGPGDPDLITVRGMRALSDADVVIADHLAPQALLAALRPEVEVVDAAKLPRGRSMPQEQINSLLVSHARAGRRVVRLKGGDPFVFGRGMEELEACTAAGIPVEVVPGVTSAIGVPGLAGIPVTHRGMTHEFVVVSGHLPPGHPDSLVDWPALGRLRGTLVVLMGVHTAAAISAALIRHGRAPDTPVAVIADGATAHQRLVRTTLAELSGTVVAEAIRPPAVWVVGDVVGLRAADPPRAGEL
jgi:uroporphyrin-III C-methyltransferase/precorrin-2 dehydrogenase/sirohydrochlorin ferrochelatase